MTRTGQAAIDYARSRVGANAMPASGYCLAFVRECFDVGSYYGSAIDAWNGAQFKHPGDRNPPPAVPLYFTSPSQYDHVVFGGAVGEIITTFNDDVKRYQYATTSEAIDAIVRDFGPGSYLGWCEDINRVTVYAAPQEDDMTPDESQRLLNIEGAVGRLDAMWTASDKRNRVHDFDQTNDWSEQTTAAVGRIEADLKGAGVQASRWTPAHLIAALAVAGLITLAIIATLAATDDGEALALAVAALGAL